MINKKKCADSTRSKIVFPLDTAKSGKWIKCPIPAALWVLFKHATFELRVETVE